jgi:hypothetical protein
MPEDAPQNKEGGDFDVVMVAGRTEDGQGAQVLRARPGKVEAGEVRPVREGKPLVGAGEVVRLEQRKDAPALYDVHVLHTAERPVRATRGGPAQVATDEYREAWERTFGKPSSSLN